MQRHDQSAMCCGWTSDGQHILSGGADGKGMMWEIATGRFTQVAAHDAPVVGIFHSEMPSSCIITGSWDKTVKFWDPTSTTGQPLGVLQVQHLRHPYLRSSLPLLSPTPPQPSKPPNPDPQSTSCCCRAHTSTPRPPSSQQTPNTMPFQMPDRVYAMDVRGSVMVVATAERHILVYDLRNLAQPFRQKFSPLKYQSR